MAYHHPSPLRDAAMRKCHEVRNALWSAWLRRPALSAWAATQRISRSSLADQARLAGILDAIKEIP